VTIHRVVTSDEWEAARKELLQKEKEFTQLRDELSQQIRELPWHKVEKEYVFDAPDGKETLAELFCERSQLLVYHFMFGPDWDEGCPACSLCADHYDPSIVHLNQRDVTMVTVSRAPLEKLDAYKERMGWEFKWVSSLGNDFNWDFRVSFTSEQIDRNEVYYNYGFDNDFQLPELPGLSVFYKDEDGTVFHTYSTYARGLDSILGVYRLLDVVPKGRDEAELPYPMAWVRRHDRYGEEELS
jgi:predicted dithiol-disulfide oxidoreductase (DUF899 family)